MGFQSDVRATAISTLDTYAGNASVALNATRGRPRHISLPQAFIDVERETITYVGHLMQRTVQVDIVLLHGLFDSGEAVDQRDAFVDGYIDYIRDNIHAAGANTQIQVVSTEDDPLYVTDWIAPSERSAAIYFATRITLEGYTAD